MDRLNETVLLKTKTHSLTYWLGKHHNFYAMKDCLTWPMWHTKNAFSNEMRFWSHCYTVVLYQTLFRLSVFKIPAVYLSGAKNVCFCTIRDFGSMTTRQYYNKDHKSGCASMKITKQACYNLQSRQCNNEDHKSGNVAYHKPDNLKPSNASTHDVVFLKNRKFHLICSNLVSKCSACSN